MSNSVDMPVARLRTASGHDLTSYGHSEQEMQMPPMEDTTCDTSELAEVRCPILSVPMLAAVDELRTAKRAVAPLTHVRGLWHLQVRINNGREFLLVDSGAACHVCPPSLGSACEPREQASSLVDQDNRPWRARAHRGGCACSGTPSSEAGCVTGKGERQ